MDFFTRAWIDGEMDDDESDRVVDAYRDHIASIAAKLSATVRLLAQEVSLHDAFVKGVVYDAQGRRLEIALLTGDLQVGYFDTVLRYESALPDQADVSALRVAAQDSRTEVLYDEVDLSGDGEYLHRMIFEPTGECEIMFRDLAVSMTPRADRKVDRLPTPFDERPLPAS